MAIKVNFADGTYSSDDFNNQFASIIGADMKIVVGNENSLKVTQSNPLANQVTIASGSCFINGKFVTNDSNSVAIVENNLSGATRKDIVVLDISNIQVPVIKVVKGNTSAPNPTATQILLAEISVKNNSLSIMDADISDKRLVQSNACTLDGLTRNDVLKPSDGNIERVNDEWSLNIFGLFTIKVGIHRSPGIHKGGWTKVSYKKKFSERCYVVLPVLIQVVNSAPTDATPMIRGSWERSDYFEISTSSATPYPFMWLAIGK